VASIAPVGSQVWIGGSPCSGKSTVAQRLALARGWPLVTCDDHWADHVGRSTRETAPVLTKLGGLPAGARLRQPLDVQVADVFEAYREEFPLILEDLVERGSPTVVEGAALLPELLAELGVPGDRAVWLVPTEEFQRVHYGRREWASNLLAGAADASALFETWMLRDVAFGRLVALQASDLGYRVLSVDGSLSPGALVAEVTAGLSTAN